MIIDVSVCKNRPKSYEKEFQKPMKNLLLIFCVKGTMVYGSF